MLSEEPAPEHGETRGPFEPLVSSSNRNRGQPSTRHGVAAPPDSGAGPPATRGDPAIAPAGRERKLDQLKDLYLTAEAIGERNLDEHFDELMAQQRQLISDYFGQPEASRAAMASSRDDEAEPPRADGGEVTPPEGLAVWAEPPRT